MASALLLAVAVVLLSRAACFAGEASFAGKPVVKKEGGGARISFAVSAPTDVEVAILDSSNRVVRHLAAGVLGSTNPPSAPLQSGLAQELAWDGKDDTGALPPPALHPPPFRVRVRAGLKAEFDGFIGESKYWIGELHGLATDSKGNLYVYSSSVPVHRGTSRYLQVFDRNGNYLRTIMPMPANLPVEKVSGFKVVPSAAGGFNPINYFGTWPEFYPGGDHNFGELTPSVTANGILTIGSGLQVARVRDDGSSVGPEFLAPVWAPGRAKNPSSYSVIGPRHMVASPDGKYLYLTGFCYALTLDKDPGLKVHADFPDGRIYRMDLQKPGAGMETFVDLPQPENIRSFSEVKQGYRAQDYFTAAHSGVDRSICDKDGNLLVCDRMNGMIRVYSPEAKELGGFKVDSPESVAIHRQSGAVYVMTCKYGPGHAATKKLIKFSSWKGDAKALAEFAFSSPKGLTARMALDDSAEPPVVWAAGDLTGKRCLLHIEDRGDKFEVTKDLMDLNKDRFGVKPRLAVHPETDLVICNDGAATLNGYNGLTGELVKLPFEYGPDMAVGLDGNWYIQVGKEYSGYICRFDKDLNPIPVANPPIGGYEGTEIARAKGSKEKPITNALGFVYGRMGAGFCTVGMAADWKGRVYSMQMYAWAPYCVAVYGPDGRAEDPGRLKDSSLMKKVGRFPSAIVAPIDTKPGGIQLDYQGNIYIGLGVVPKDHVPPPGFEKDPGYNTCVGSVVKFKPEGGAVYAASKDKPLPTDKTGLTLEHRSYGRGPRLVENALRVYPGLGVLGGGHGDGCMCRQPMFQVDGFGRLFYPNAILCSVRAVDNAGNEILSFGQYGNIDSAGPKSLIPKPDVPLGWPEAVGVSEKAIYVSDVLNRRIMRLMKKYAAEETMEIQ